MGYLIQHRWICRLNFTLKVIYLRTIEKLFKRKFKIQYSCHCPVIGHQEAEPDFKKKIRKIPEIKRELYRLSSCKKYRRGVRGAFGAQGSAQL